MRNSASREVGRNLKEIKESMYTNAVAQATAVLQECEAFRASCSSPRLKKKADSLDANAVPGDDGLRECEAPRVVQRMRGVYTNAVVPCDDVEAAPSSSYANAVAQATAGRDVFLDTGSLYLVHAQELVSLQGGGDLSLVMEQDRGQVPWILARAALRRSNLAHVFDLELLSSDDIAQLAAGEFEPVATFPVD